MKRCDYCDLESVIVLVYRARLGGRVSTCRSGACEEHRTCPAFISWRAVHPEADVETAIALSDRQLEVLAQLREGVGLTEAKGPAFKIAESLTAKGLAIRSHLGAFSGGFYKRTPLGSREVMLRGPLCPVCRRRQLPNAPNVGAGWCSNPFHVVAKE